MLIASAAGTEAGTGTGGFGPMQTTSEHRGHPV